ncbi:MAG: hypothetical protein VKJ24_13360 [Synechococcales bacterium]|nr:hypothetical protein [Synechococcales bacterium]
MHHGRWGVFYSDRLLATVGSEREARKLVATLNNRLQADPLPPSAPKENVRARLKSAQFLPTKARQKTIAYSRF